MASILSETKNDGPEFGADFSTWKQAPSLQSTGKLLKTVDPVITTALRTYGGSNMGSPTLRSRARRLAVDAFNTFDPDKGNLRTHLLSQLRRLQRVSAQEQNIISIPEQVSSDVKMVMDAETSLRDQLGRDPSDFEIADSTGLSLKRLKYIRQANVPVAEGTAEARADSDASGMSQTPSSTLPGQDTSDAWRDFVYADLQPVDQAIMDYTLGLHGSPQLPATEIARRLNVSPSAISQRTAKIQMMLNERESLGLL